MTTVRRNLKIGEVSLCKSPANPQARIALFKSADPIKEPNMPKFDKTTLDDDGQKFVTDLEKDAETARSEAETLKAEAAKKDEEIEALKAKVAKPEDDGEMGPDGKKKKKPNPFGKEALPEDAREYVEGIEKSASDAAAETEELKKKNDDQEKRIAKMEDDALTADVNSFIDTVPYAVSKDDRDAEVKVLKSLEGDARERYQKGLTRQHEGMKTSGTFNEIGKGGDQEGGATAHDQTTAKAVEIRKASPDLTEQQAYAKALEDNPDLYAEHRAEQTPTN